MLTAKTSVQKRAATDLILVLTTLFASKYFLLQFTSLWTFAGPISLLASLGVANWRLKLNEESWRALGFAQDQSIIKLVSWTVFALIITIIIGMISGQLAESFFNSQSVNQNEFNQVMEGRFDNLPGNLPIYLFWLSIGWIIGGFTEELLFRGFLINRFESLLKQLPFAIGFAVVIQAVIFGQQHFYYQGIAGAIATGTIAIASGAIYVFCKRRLWPLILSHGIANTLGMSIIYLGN
ncbi:CPBP family intramembrane metalloprotease [Aliikangiella marina]|uniref:CPBP family intramembrane metalloprotease n=1 Tax=Aliikangiella marina TaxID=1712262 RepID=A0A545T6C4_9GAMM|nr:type II CAAX endopeptidase family protein [Aliikangiella marina]TQV72776.1 CPBP family intramembrane metalloprotease [Aliikangiella marina]